MAERSEALLPKSSYEPGLSQAGGRVRTPVFGQTVNPISTMGADYAHPILVSTPSFESHRRACMVHTQHQLSSL